MLSSLLYTLRYSIYRTALMGLRTALVRLSLSLSFSYMFEIICCVSNSLYCLSSSNKQTNIIISFLLRVYRLLAYVFMINCTTLLVKGMKRECDQNKQYRLSYHHDRDFIYTSLTLFPNLFELEKGL